MINLQPFMDNFYGYGNPKADYWFVGMEEGGGGTPVEIQKRITAWNTLGRPCFADLQKFHALIGMPQFFTPPVEGQNTWMGLIKILLSALGNEPYDPPAERLKEYQASSSWGCLDGDTLLTELLPLPAPSTEHWLYQELSDLPELRSRKTYRHTWAPKRADEIKRLVDEHNPKVVVFYSSDKKWYRQWWQLIAGAQFTNASANTIEVAHRDGTTFLIVDHPVSPGSQDYFLEAGRIADLESTTGATAHPKAYSVWKPGEPPRRSIYRRFWTKLLSEKPTFANLCAPFPAIYTGTGSGVEVRYSTRVLPTSFLYAISLAGKWAVAQCNIPLQGRSKAETTALKVLVKQLLDQPIFVPNTPFIHEIGQIQGRDTLFVKQVFRGELVDDATWPALHKQMRDAMAQLQAILCPFL